MISLRLQFERTPLPELLSVNGDRHLSIGLENEDGHERITIHIHEHHYPTGASCFRSLITNHAAVQQLRAAAMPRAV